MSSPWLPPFPGEPHVACECTPLHVPSKALTYYTLLMREWVLDPEYAELLAKYGISTYSDPFNDYIREEFGQ